MHPSTQKGNSPEAWNGLLEGLDQKLQLGLLDHLKRVSSYHFEDNILTIEMAKESDFEYLTRSAVLQQLQIFVKDITGIEKTEVKEPAQ